ncbi:MAG: class I SAM-dependent methyltransferase [Candidatus Kapaibacterium sp.]
MSQTTDIARDKATAEAFADSWNNLPAGSVYTREQFEDWFEPLHRPDIEGKSVVELGCGNASLLVHMAQWNPSELVGIDLGSSVASARENMTHGAGTVNWRVEQADLTTYRSSGFDVVYSIGVLHHLKEPFVGFQSVLANTKPGGHFHCWVYGREGNGIVIALVEPIRKIVCHLPWWLTKYGVATTLAIPFFLYGLLFRIIRGTALAEKLPLGGYMSWISKRGFQFFRHVAFDQLVTPQTTFLPRATIEAWLRSDPRITETYIIHRNGNSWKFGGRVGV